MTSKVTDIIRQLRTVIIRTMTACKPELPLPELAVVFAPHPDDEVFGCCGLMKRMLTEGRQVELVVMTGGGRSHAGCCNLKEDALVDERRELTINAAALYGLGKEHIHFLDYPDGGVQLSDGNTEVLQHVLTTIGKSAADKRVAVFYPHMAGEGWNDHIRTSEIAKQLSASIFPNAEQYEYCVWFWFYNCWKIEWNHASLLKMTRAEYDTKLRAIDAYVKPVAPCGNPWSGVLPPVFLWVNKWLKELYFQVK